MKYDTIVIGAGLGGLTAGAKLAKEGKKVLLIEQHDRPGGCATTFQRGDFTFEVGLHEMDGLDPRDMKTRIFKDLGVFEHVEFIKVPEFYHFVHGDFQLTIPHDPHQASEILIQTFPDDEEGIKTYFDQIMNARKKAKESENEPENNVGDFLDSIIRNEQLKLVLLGNLGYFHDDPYSLSLNYYSAAQGSYYQGGGNFIKGGSQKLSDCLAGIITSNGGQVLLNHLVTSIITDDHKATGVTYKKVSRGEEPLMTAVAGNIIANASIPLVAGKLLPKQHGSTLGQQVEDLENGASLLTIYLGFDTPPARLGSTKYSTFFYDETIAGPKGIKANNRGDFAQRSFTYVDYSQVDSSLTSDGKGVGVICCIDYLDQWEQLSPEQYKARKREVADIFIGKLERYIPGISKHITHVEVGTSKTVARYTMNPGGAVYGFAQTPHRVRKESPLTLENLHFASAWTKTGGGFSGAIFSGYLCAMGLLRTGGR